MEGNIVCLGKKIVSAESQRHRANQIADEKRQFLERETLPKRALTQHHFYRLTSQQNRLVNMSYPSPYPLCTTSCNPSTFATRLNPSIVPADLLASRSNLFNNAIGINRVNKYFDHSSFISPLPSYRASTKMSSKCNQANEAIKTQASYSYIAYNSVYR